MFLFPCDCIGRVIYALYIMSDCYLGMDQQYEVCLDVREADIGAQFNTEVEFEDGELDKLLDEELNGLDD